LDLIVLLCLFSVSRDVPDLVSTGEPEHGFRTLEAVVADAVIADSLGEPLEPAPITEALEDLIRAVSTAMMTRVDVSGPALEAPARSELLFGHVPSIPPGEGPHRIVLEPEADMLFVYGVRLEADRPVRIQQVVLRFADGPDLRRDLDEDTGRLGAGRHSPLIGDERGPARVLREIEITGWVREADEPARLELSFSIPDPGSRPYRGAMAELMTLRDRWAGLPLDEDGLARRAGDLDRLAPMLGLTRSP